ncbi:hypothetical protein KFU94_52050 [Chloroflexi bacterium TSY]|uniref:Uncharacterized protein n=1 Tax=Entotheonella factor TaxID=1429438 RepID=W4LFL4_ENTF1|nr:MAG: hypothetical protein ETSY1_25510 [Candidatus Entotheonella factor]MBV7336631.1 hypothetical protein [Chloroflexi bacterium TSY]
MNRAGLGVIAALRRTGEIEHFISSRYLADLAGISRDSAQRALRFLCPQLMTAYQRGRERDLLKARELLAQVEQFTDGAAALKLLTGKQRATVADRMRRHESKNLLAEVVMYCADRVANIERELTRVNSMIARGECVPLLESIARGGGPYANTYRLNLAYLVDIEPKCAQHLPQSLNDDGPVETVLWQMLRALYTLSENLHDDAFQRNRPDPDNEHARRLLDLAQTIGDEGERRRRIVELAGRVDVRLLDSIGPAGPYIIDALDQQDHTYESLAAAVGMHVGSIRRTIARMGPKLEAIGIDPLVAIYTETGFDQDRKAPYRKTTLSLSEEWRANLTTTRQHMTTDGTVMKRTIRHARERLLRLSLLRGQITAAEVLADIDRIEADCQKLLDTIDPRQALDLSADLAEVENKLPDIQPIRDEAVWEYLLRLAIQGDAQGETAERLLDLAQRDALNHSESAELRALANRLGIPHCFSDIKNPVDVDRLEDA